MDLKSGGLVMLSVLVGLFLAIAAQGDLDAYSPQAVEEVEVYFPAEQDDQSSASGNLPTKDVFVVSSDTNADYALFVENAINAVVNGNGDVTYKEPGGDFEQIKSPNNYDHKLAMANAAHDPIANDIIAVMAKSDARYNIFVLVVSAADLGKQSLDLMKALVFETRSRINIFELDKGSRGKRAFSASSIYQQLAAASGGMVITATKNNIGQVANLIKQSIKANTVDIMRFDFDKPGGQKFQIPVDGTMTQLTVQIQTNSALPVAMITSGSGLPVSPKNSATPLGSKLMLYEFNITKPTDYGQWKYTKLAGGDWDVKVTGQSQVDFTYAFMEPGPGGLGSYPIKGRPIAGKQYQIKVTVPQYDKLKMIVAAVLLDNHNTPIGTHGVVSLQNVGGRRGKSIFTGNVTTPSVDFRVAFEAMDKNMRQCRRLDPFLVTPISIKLIINSVGATKLHLNETTTIDFSVVNEASQKQSILVRIEDDQKFAQSPVNLFYNDVKANERCNGTFKIRAGTIPGITDTVTITAKPYVKGQQTQGQFEIRRFTVEDVTTTTSSTLTTSLPTSLSSSTVSSQSTMTSGSTNPSSNSSNSVSLTTSSSGSTAKLRTNTAGSSTSSKSSVSSGASKSSGSPSNLSSSGSSQTTGSKQPGGQSPGQTNPPGSSQSKGNSGTSGGSSNPSGNTSYKTSSNSNTASSGPTSNHGNGNTGSSTSQSSGQTNPPGSSKSKTAKSVASEESKSGVPESAVAAGMTIGTIGAVSAVAVMAVLFRRISKQAAKGVTPSSESRRDSAWS